MRHRVPVLTHRARFGVGLLSTLGLAATVACATAAPDVRAAVVPAVPVLTLAGAATDLRAAVAGKVALVSLWATWCDACTREVDALNRLEAGTASRGDALVLGVAVGEPRETVAAFAKRRGLTYPLVVDEDFLLADALGERKVPATLVFDRAGKVVYRGEALDAASLEAFRRALGPKP